MLSEDVWVVIRSKNDASLIGKTLEAIASQDYPGRIRRLHIDSGSTDGTSEIIRDSKPDQFLQIRAEDYIPGRVLNTGMKLSDSQWVVFLNSDAEPVGRDWLKNLLAAASQGGKVGAVFGRQVPRPDCEAVFARDYERCFGAQRESSQWPHFFSMVSSAANRSAWLEHPFREDLQYAEDDEWSFRLKQNGWEVRYAEQSIVMHSHNYTVAQARKRSYGDSFAVAATSKSSPSDFGFLQSVVLAGTRDVIHDLVFCLRAGRLAEWPRSLAIRYAQRAGRRDGFLAGYKHFGRE